MFTILAFIIQILNQLSGLHASVLTSYQRGKSIQYVVNFDENVRVLLRELVCLNRFGCPIPKLGMEIHRRSLFLKKRIGMVQVRLDDAARIHPCLQREKVSRVAHYISELYYRTEQLTQW